jgi:hypothetical protein
MMGAFKALSAVTRATVGMLATAGTIVLMHLGAAGTVTKMLWRTWTILIGLKCSMRTVATWLMIGVWTAHAAGALLAAGIGITTRSVRASVVFIARTRRRLHVSTTTGFGATLRLGAAAIVFTALGIATLRLGATTIGLTAFRVATLGLGAQGLGIAARGLGTAFGAGSRRIGAPGFRGCRRCRGLGGFLGRKRGDADGAEAEQHQTMAGCGFHGLEWGSDSRGRSAVLGTERRRAIPIVCPWKKL